ncbi:MAG: hypothetical protein LBC20_02335 [Planctomycetaceae bacterium]|jgi:hypothetical protein|nr:hypothetical protein [Planctomycetaceae bacterium]
MDNMLIITISEKYKSIQAFFDERSKRVWAAAEAKSIGRGDPMTPLLWTSKSLSKIVVALKEEKHNAGITTVRKLELLNQIKK